MMHSTLIANAIVFGFLFSIWRLDGFFNMMLKTLMFGMLALNFYLLVK